MNRLKSWVLDLFNKIVCKFSGHRPLYDHEKDMFGYEYVFQKCHCSRCGKRLRSLESTSYPHHYE